MGRPPKFGRPMTSSERSRWRRAGIAPGGEQQTQRETHITAPGAAEIAHLKLRIIELEAEIAGLIKAATKPATKGPDRLDAAEIERRVAQEIERRIDDELTRRVNAEMPRYREALADATIIMSEKPPFSDKEYRNIVACLHPDLVTGPKEKKRAQEAFTLVQEHKGVLARKPLPPPPPGMPRTMAEMMMRRARVKAERSRKAKEAAAHRKAKKSPLPKSAPAI